MSTKQDPATEAVAITPANGTRIAATRAVYVGGGGDLAVVMIGGNAVTFTGVPAGSILPICVNEVRSTNTTATAILALY
jgi:hypothetical protein